MWQERTEKSDEWLNGFVELFCDGTLVEEHLPLIAIGNTREKMAKAILPSMRIPNPYIQPRFLQRE